MKNLEETIKVLTHIQENPQSTQRELVRRMNVSLGKVNFLIKALSEKGIIKLERFKYSKNKKKYLYIITPKGMVEKTRMMKEFFNQETEKYEKLRSDLKELKLKIDLTEK